MTRALRRTLAILALGLILSASSLLAARAEQRTLQMDDNPHYKPPSTDVNPGDKVRWHNSGTIPHRAEADNEAFDTGQVGPGEDSEFVTLTQPGTYTYRCTISGPEHEEAKGTIVVKEAPDPEFSPSPQTTPDDLSTALPPDEQAAASPSPQPSPSPTPSPSPSPTKSPTPSPTPSESPSPRAVGGESGGGISPATVIAIIGLVVAAAAGGGLWWYRRTRATP